MCLRDNISLLTEGVSVEIDRAPVYGSHVTRPAFYDGVDAYGEAHLKPVHSISVDGVPILNVFRLDGDAWARALAKQE